MLILMYANQSNEVSRILILARKKKVSIVCLCLIIISLPFYLISLLYVHALFFHPSTFLYVDSDTYLSHHCLSVHLSLGVSLNCLSIVYHSETYLNTHTYFETPSM